MREIVSPLRGFSSPFGRGLGPAPLLSAIAANGWLADWASGTPPTFAPNSSPISIAATQQGFTATAGTPGSVTATTYTSNYIPTLRYRDPAPGEATLKAAQVVLNDFLYSTTSLSSATASPKPVAQWTTAGRQLIDTANPTATGGVIAAHRDGIAAVQVILRDVNGLEITQTITAPSWVQRPGDFTGVEEYTYSIDCSTLANGVIRRRFKVYPRFGGAASVLDSDDVTVHTRAAASLLDWKGVKYYVYVDTAGNDTTGAVSTNVATAAATPCQTIAGAIARAGAVMPGNRIPGLEITLNAGTFTSTNVSFGTYQNVDTAEVIITRNPSVARANVILTFSTQALYWMQYLRLQDLTMERTGNVNFAGQLNGQLVLRDITWTTINTPTTVLQPTIPVYYEGGITFPSGVALANHLLGTNIWMIRGCQGGSQSALSNMINYHIAGCRILGAAVGPNSQSESNGLCVESYLSQATTASSAPLNCFTTAGLTATGYLLRNLVIEHTSSNANNPSVGLALSPDGTGSSTVHVMVYNVTVAGVANAGRINFGYDESSGTTRRSHSLWRVEGCLGPQFNHKSERFVWYSQSNADSVNRIGAHPVTMGVGFGANFVCALDAAGAFAGQSRVGATGNFSQEFDGIGTIKATTTTRIDPKYTAPACTTLSGSTYTSGAGGGVYTLQSDSPAKNAMTRKAWSPAFDLAGVSRGAVGAATSIGAYA